MSGPLKLEIPASVVRAWERLNDELWRAQGTVPCQTGSASVLWTSEQVEDRQDAVHRCGPCPAFTACAGYAEAAKEPHGVWAGVDRTPRPGRPPKGSRRREVVEPNSTATSNPKRSVRAAEEKRAMARERCRRYRNRRRRQRAEPTAEENV